MSFNFSKSKFVSTCTRCNKWAWLDRNLPEMKKPVDEFTESLFDNGHKVGDLAKEYFGVTEDVTTKRLDEILDIPAMIRKTTDHLDLGTGLFAEASFSYKGWFCSVDILARNTDGSYDIYEVKSSKPDKPTNNNPRGLKKDRLIDVAYQRYVLQKCGLRINKVYLVMLNREYVRERTLDLSKYFVILDVSAEADARQAMVASKLSELMPILSDPHEPVTDFSVSCNKCDYFGYCGRHIPTPSPFDVYGLDFSDKRKYYLDGVSFFDIPSINESLSKVAKLQIEYYNRPGDTYIDKTAVKHFLDTLQFPLYSLDFETYQAVVPEHEGMKTYVQVPFQYSLHIMKKADGDYCEGSPDLEEKHFLDLSGGDPRRTIAESLVKNIPYGACVIAYNHSTEKTIVKRLAEAFPDLADHLFSFTYRDPLAVFKNGDYYVSAMGRSLSLKSVAPALYPGDPSMDYHNLEGDIKNGTQAMNAIFKAKHLSSEEVEQLRVDLEKYCALDTYAVVKILEKFYKDVK